MEKMKDKNMARVLSLINHLFFNQYTYIHTDKPDFFKNNYISKLQTIQINFRN